MRLRFNLKPNVFGSLNYLCHYTSFTNLCSILSTMTLRISSYRNSNDIAELDSNISCILNSNKTNEVEEYIANQCGYISFSTNILDVEKDIISKVGYLIPSMWGIYADKSKGACLVLDEEILKKENQKELLGAEWYDFIDVSYAPWQSLKLVSAKETTQSIVKNNYCHLLGFKHYSWSCEQERRLIGVGLPNTISLKNGVIKGIVLGKNVSEKNKKMLYSILDDKNLACFRQVNRSQFVIQEFIGGNVVTSNYGEF